LLDLFNAVHKACKFFKLGPLIIGHRNRNLDFNGLFNRFRDSFLQHIGVFNNQ
jgi:hypothetical protein